MAQIIIYNGLTGETIEREETAAEKLEREQTQKRVAERAEIEATENAAKQVARQAVLDKLGLTADEAQALFG